MGLDEYDYSGGGDKDVTSHASRNRLPRVLFSCASCFGQAATLIVIKR